MKNLHIRIKSGGSASSLTRHNNAVLIALIAFVPVVAFGVETDRITVEDPTTGAVMFRVTSEGNVTGGSFIGQPSDGAAISIQQGPTESGNAVKMSLKDNTGSSKFVVQSNGSVGIGATPDRPLLVDTSNNTLAAGESSILIQGSANKERFELRSMGGDPIFQAKGSSNNSSVPGATAAGRVLFGLGGSGHDGTNYVIPNKVMIRMFSANAWTTASQGTYLTLETTPVGSTAKAERIRILDSGNVGIGTVNPSQKLEVSGNVKATAFIGDGSQLSNLPTGGTWGTVTGTLSNQTDLQSVLNSKVNTSSLAAVATTGSYGDLTNKPVIPSAETQSTIFSKMAIQTDGAVLTVQQGPTTDTASTVKFAVKDNTGSSKFVVQSNGSVGIGSTPDRPLLVDSSNNTLAAGQASILVQGSANKERFELRSMGGDPIFQAKGSSNNLGVPGATEINKVLFGLGGSGHDGTNYIVPNRVMIRMLTANAWTTASQGTYMTFETTPIGSTAKTERIRILDSGNVGIGTNDPKQKLEVNGGIRLNDTPPSNPTCDANARGTFWFTQGGTGEKDTAKVCAKDAEDAYAWRTIW